MSNFEYAKYDLEGNRDNKVEEADYISVANVTLAELVRLVAKGVAGTFYVSDVGGGTMFVSNGTDFYPMGGTALLAKWGTPIGKPSSGTIGANGALSNITALNRIYSEGIYLHFPAGALYSGSEAGFYYTIMNGTQTGTVYNNRLVTGAPEYIANPTPIVSASIGGYTQTTNEVTAVTIPIQGGLLGRDGGLQSNFTMIANGTAGNKTHKQYYGALNQYDVSFGTNTLVVGFAEFTNVSPNYQKSTTAPFVGLGLTSGVVQNLREETVDSTITQNWRQTLQLAVATDWVIITANKLMLWK